jgi:ribosome biogenesis GTPase A
MERRTLAAVDASSENAVMQRIKRPPVRNKIDLSDPTQIRAWTRRLRVSADELKAVTAKVGNSVAAVTKEIELQRTSRQPGAVPAAIPSPTIEGELTSV